MSALGSVFLGDVQRHRILSSTPPSSPPPGDGATEQTGIVVEDALESLDGTDPPEKMSPSPHPVACDPPPPDPPTIDPVLSLELRLRWLEALLLGVRPHETRERKGGSRFAGSGDKPPELKPGDTLVRLAGDVQRRLSAVVDSNDALNKFIHHYDQHAALLTPAFALSGTLPAAPSYESMSADELETFLADLEPDVRTAERDMREIELLEHKGVLSAGKLAEYAPLQPRLRALLAAQAHDMALATSLEKRIAVLVERHATQVDTLSELFVAWDDVLIEAENKVKRLERDKGEQERLGYM